MTQEKTRKHCSEPNIRCARLHIEDVRQPRTMRCDAYRHGASPPASFADCWDRLARERGGDLALADARSALTWRDAADLSRRLARGLLLFGLKAGEVVACW